MFHWFLLPRVRLRYALPWRSWKLQLGPMLKLSLTTGQRQRKSAHPGRTPEPCPRQSRMVYGGALGGRTAVITRALRPRGTTETLAAPISCGRGSACRKRAILCAKCAKLPFCAPERSAEGNRKASAQHKASGVSQRLTALPTASAALRVKILFAIIGTFITRPVKE